MVHPFRCYGSEVASAHPPVRQVIDKAKAAVAEAFMPPQGNHTYIPDLLPYSWCHVQPNSENHGKFSDSIQSNTW